MIFCVEYGLDKISNINGVVFLTQNTGSLQSFVTQRPAGAVTWLDTRAQGSILTFQRMKKYVIYSTSTSELIENVKTNFLEECGISLLLFKCRCMALSDYAY